jgi:peptidoglycan/xylan/chitin deacetylase (PgdA/CDA1 family)
VFHRVDAWLEAGRGYYGGMLRGGVRRRGIRIFRYHGVIERRNDPLLERNQHEWRVFTDQMDYLRRCRLLGLDEFLDGLERPGSLPDSAALVTFDDGFANNLRVAEFMDRRRLPWTLFASVGEIGEDRALWLDEFSMLALYGNATRLEVLGTVWPLSTREERERVFRLLRPALKMLPSTSKNAAVDSIRAQFPPGESARLLARFPSLRMLTWKELGSLADAGVAIGSHGVFHEAHHAEQPSGERLRELCESRREIEKRLSRPCRAFAYPNGNYVSESPDEAARAGYGAAFTTEVTPIDATTSRYLLPRLSAPQSLRRFVRVHWWQDPAPPAPRPAVAAARA